MAWWLRGQDVAHIIDVEYLFTVVDFLHDRQYSLQEYPFCRETGSAVEWKRERRQKIRVLEIEKIISIKIKKQCCLN